MTARVSFSRDEVLAAYEGRSLREAADLLGCSVEPLRHLVREYGITVRPRGRPKLCPTSKGHAVYVLCDPREPDAIRYVGLSCNVVSRLNYHISESRRHLEQQVRRSHKLNWLAQLTSADVRPTLRVLAVLETAQEAARVEQALIYRFRQRGYRLTNDTDGGEGVDGNGVRLTEEAVERKRESMKAHWASESGMRHREKNRRSAQEAMADPEYAGGPRTEEAREKMRLAKLGKPHARQRTPEWNAKISAAQKGISKKLTPEQEAKRVAKLGSPETRERMRQSALARHARRRAAASDPGEKEIA